jgi:hypothetical protein
VKPCGPGVQSYFWRHENAQKPHGSRTSLIFPRQRKARHFWPGSFLSLDHGFPGFQAAVTPFTVLSVFDLKVS